MAEQMIAVEIIFAKPDRQVSKTVQIELGSNVQQAIVLSGILNECPEIDLNSHKVGIFSQLCDLKQILQPADRVEIYRPLLQDPKDARRQRAIKAQPRRKSKN